MSKNICLVCQHSNPEGLEYCQNCHAQLKIRHEDQSAWDGKSENAGNTNSQHGGIDKREIFEDPSLYWKPDSEISSRVMNISKWEESQSAILERILATEGEEIKTPDQPVIKSNHFLRICVAMIMLLSVLWPLVSQFAVRKSSQIKYVTQSSVDLINRYPAGTITLVAVDYDPGFSAEMDASLGSVLDQMMRRDFYLVLVSTVPHGPVQTERLLLKINKSEGYNYQAGLDYANLGYIPGGSIGLRGFLEAPRQVFPHDMKGSKIWEIDPIERVRSISDFNLIIVATEKVDTAKTWVEQLQTGFKDIPLIFVLSVQAEPMMQPYYDENADQIQAIVSRIPIGMGESSKVYRSYLGSVLQPIEPSLFAGGTLFLGGVFFFGIKKLIYRRKDNNKGDLLNDGN